MKNVRILVVDDEHRVCISCDRLLSEEGYEVDTSQDPEDGLVMAEQNSYDVILVDLKMPGISGMEFLRRTKAMRPDTEVVMMTGFAQISTAVEAVDCGALHDSLLESELFGHAKGAFTGAISAKKGLFEVADGGTLFLDEVANTSVMLQAKLLRFLQQRVFTPVGHTQERKTDVRLIAATNQDLDVMVAEGAFREDLFYRLNIVPVDVPPLRKRKEDLPALAIHFLKKFREETGYDVSEISPDALSLLVDYDWPGNVRELENVIHRAVVLATDKTIVSGQLPAEIRDNSLRLTVCIPKTSEELKQRKRELREKSVEEVERRFVTEALKRNDWNVTHAAADVGMQRPNFQALMRKHHIALPQVPPSSDTS